MCRIMYGVPGEDGTKVAENVSRFILENRKLTLIGPKKEELTVPDVDLQRFECVHDGEEPTKALVVSPAMNPGQLTEFTARWQQQRQQNGQGNQQATAGTQGQTTGQGQQQLAGAGQGQR